MDWQKLKLFLSYASKVSGKSETALLIDSFKSIFTYNISILEYFQFRFFEKNDNERQTYAGTGYMYEYQLLMNPIHDRVILDDKRLFAKTYSKFFVHTVTDLHALRNNKDVAKKLLGTPSGKVVLKSADGKCGATVEVLETKMLDADSLIIYMEKHNLDVAEEYIIQHQVLNELSPSGVNTVRIFTEISQNNKVTILGCRQRISINSKVDNMAAGNIAAQIDPLSGVIIGPGVYSDITKQDEEFHPITGVSIVGFQVPFWEETLAMVKEAALLYPQNRSIGWDVVITDNGPGFIEGNHDWCKLLWQLPAKKGLKPLLNVIT